MESSCNTPLENVIIMQKATWYFWNTLNYIQRESLLAQIRVPEGLLSQAVEFDVQSLTADAMVK